MSDKNFSGVRYLAKEMAPVKDRDAYFTFGSFEQLEEKVGSQPVKVGKEV